MQRFKTLRKGVYSMLIYPFYEHKSCLVTFYSTIATLCSANLAVFFDFSLQPVNARLQTKPNVIATIKNLFMTHLLSRLLHL